MLAIALPALLWMGIASLIFGIIVMIFPKILNYLVGIYLIIIGNIGQYSRTSTGKDLTII